MEQSAIISGLSQILDTLEDAHAGYQVAAQGIKDMKVKRALGQIALERKGFCEAVRTDLVRLGAAPPRHGTFKGALHRGWIQLKELGHATPATILEECSRGEAASIRIFKDALEKDLRSDVRQTVALQLERITAARERILELRRSTVTLPDAPKS